MSVETLYCVPLSDAEKARLRERVLACRVSALDYLLTASTQPAIADRLGSRWPQLQVFLEEIGRFLEEEPETFSSLIDHWAAVFLLHRLTEDGVREEGQIERLLGNLHALLAAERLRRKGGREILCFVHTDDEGRIYDLVRQGWLKVAGAHPAAPLRFEFRDGEVALSNGNGLPPAVYHLPANGQGPVDFVPFGRLQSWRLPLIDDSFLLGAEPRLRRLPDAETWRPPALAHGLEGAHETLRAHWPEVLQWVDALVPAFVNMGDPPGRTSQRSESYGPGSPIFLSAAATEMQIAEAVCHELQHERLLLFANGELFQGWGEATRRFVSPWRRDVRPVRGLYLAIHAFLAVNELRLRSLPGEPSPESRLQLLQTHSMNLFTFRTLVDHDSFSPAGERVLGEWARALAAHHAAIAPLAGEELWKRVDGFFEQHVAAVAAHGLELVNATPRYRAWDAIARDAAAFGARA